MDKLTVTLKTVTPMFLGGADYEASSIRPPSVKGVLRFWWRAINWGRFYEKNCKNETEALKKLHEEEKLLFGSAAEDERGRQAGGQGCFLLTVKNPQLNTATLTTPAKAGIAYLLGQGLYKPGNNAQYSRAAFEKNQDIEVAILFKNNLPPNMPTDYRDQIENALWLLGLLGGLGSRSRRGFGSLSLKAVTGSKLDLQVPTDVDSFKAVLKNLIGNVAAIPEPPFSAFSSQSRVDISIVGNEPMVILNDIGIQLLRYRSWGVFVPRQNRHEAPLGQKAEQKFVADHMNMLNAVQGTCPTSLPKRVIFGLPHNYFFKSEFDTLFRQKKQELITQGKTDQEADRAAKKWARARAKAEILPVTDGRKRRASPLFIHVHRLTQTHYLAIQMILPARFLPDNDLVNIGTERLASNCNLPVSHNWDVLHNYLDRFNDGGGKFYG